MTGLSCRAAIALIVLITQVSAPLSAQEAAVEDIQRGGPGRKSGSAFLRALVPIVRVAARCRPFVSARHPSMATKPVNKENCGQPIFGNVWQQSFPRSSSQ